MSPSGHSSSGVGLVVDYGSTDLEDVVIKEEEEMVARLRVRSVPLHGDDCIHVQEGEHVLATPKLRPKSLFFDAAVEKVHNLSILIFLLFNTEGFVLMGLWT